MKFRFQQPALALSWHVEQALPLESHVTQLRAESQGRASRSIFWAFCDALRERNDPLTGGAPQLIGLYRIDQPRTFGVVYDGNRHFQGLLLQNDIKFDGIEWRDEYFQRLDGESMLVIAGARRHGRA